MGRPGKEADLLIVGGGPAGLAVAIRARLSGFRVQVIDRAHPPIDKACGEGLMPDAIRRLHDLGVTVPIENRTPLRGIRYIADGWRARGEFRGGPGWGVRRVHLHRALVERAERLGVDLLWGLAARRLERGGVRTDAGWLRGGWLVAADGLHSRLRAWAGVATSPGKRARFGVRRHYALPPWTPFVEVYWAEGCEAYVTPLGVRQIGVAMLWSGGPASFDGLLERFPTLRRRLCGARPDSEDRGAGPLEQRVQRVVCGNLALVGDASGYVDAITGEGLALALHQAFALVDAIERGDLRAYAVAHRRLGRLPDRVTRALLWVERRPRLRRKMVRALAADPELFSRLVSIHARALPLRGLGLLGALRMGWRLLGPGDGELYSPARSS